MLSDVLKQKDRQTKIQYPIGSEVRVKHGGDWGVVDGYNESEVFRHKTRDVSVIKVKHHFGAIKDYAANEIERWTESTEPKSILGILLCRLGYHDFEKEPSRKDFVKTTGINLVFWTSGVQKAIKVCKRKGCQAQQKVWRSGWCGAGGAGTPWKSLSPRKEAEIDSLHNI